MVGFFLLKRVRECLYLKPFAKQKIRRTKGLFFLNESVLDALKLKIWLR